MKKVNTKIFQYWVVKVGDYHEFDLVQEAYESAGIKTKFEEVGYLGAYQAVFWVGKHPTKYIKDLKEEIDNESN